ncbi:hypothetical protein FI667_g6737, partial [Globisporangium splendens]
MWMPFPICQTTMSEERSRRRSRTPPPTRRPLSPAALDDDANASAATTTIGKYIARFRNEQPLPREARAELNKDEFWWKYRPSSPNSTTSAAAAKERLTVKTRAHKPHRYALDETMHANPSSVSSSRTSRSRHSSRSSSIPRDGVDPRGDDVSRPDNALLSASGGAESLLFLSSVSSSSFLPSDLEPPSRPSSTDISQHAMQDGRGIEATDLSSFCGNDVAMELRLSMEEEEHRNDEDDGGEQTLEDPELVIERVRMRLGFRRNEGLAAFSLGTTAYKDEGESVFLGSPLPLPWRQRMMRVDNSFHPSNHVANDDVMANGVSHERRHSPDSFISNRSLELALSEWNSEHDFSLTPERSDAARFDGHGDPGHERVELLLSPVTTQGVPMPTSQDKTPNRVDPHTNGADAVSSVVLEPAIGGSPSPNQQEFQFQANGVDAFEAVKFVPSSIDQQHFENKLCDYTLEKKSPSFDGDGNGDRIVNEDSQPNPVEEPVEAALRDGDHTPSPIMANSHLRHSENTVVTAALPALSASPLRTSASVSASSPFSSSSSHPSSYSSVTAETAKTLDGLVSLVVQSWSSDLFHLSNDGDGDSGSSKNSSTSNGDASSASVTSSQSCGKTQAAHDDSALSKQQQGSSSEFSNDPVHAETQTKKSLSASEDCANDTQGMDSQRGVPPPTADSDQDSMSEPTAITASSPLSSCSPSDAAGLNSAITSVGAGDVERSEGAGKRMSYDQQREDDACKDNDEEDESDLHEEDEMARMLLSRIALYEQALQQLEQPREEEG